MSPPHPIIYQHLKNLINIKSYFFPHPSMHPLRAPPPCTPSHSPSMHPLCTHLCTPPLCTPPCTPSTHPLRPPLHTPLCTPPLRTPSTHPIHAPLHTPLCTPPPCTLPHTPPSDWLSVPTTSNHIAAFKNLINIKS